MKTLHPDLFPETLLVNAEAGRVFTTSLKVAKHFHKRHDNVVHAIETLLLDLSADDFLSPKLGRETDFSLLNFEERNYQYITGRKQVREAKMYNLTHDGFALLAMGFTGKEALAWKVQFLSAFRDMERQIVAQQKRESNALFLLRPKWGPIVARPDMRREQLIGLTGHRSPNSITACRRRMRDIGLIN